MVDTGPLFQFHQSTKYEYLAVERYLESPLPSELDSTFSHLCAQYRQADEKVRCAINQSLDGNRSAWLNVFAQRMAMLSVRRQSTSLLKDALTALLVIAHRDDRNSFLMTLSIVHHSATKLGDPEPIFQDVAQCACDTESADLILDFLDREPRDKCIEAMGYRESMGEHGLIYLFGNQKIPVGWE